MFVSEKKEKSLQRKWESKKSLKMIARMPKASWSTSLCVPWRGFKEWDKRSVDGLILAVHCRHYFFARFVSTFFYFYFTFEMTPKEDTRVHRVSRAETNLPVDSPTFSVFSKPQRLDDHAPFVPQHTVSKCLCEFFKSSNTTGVLFF